MVLHALQVIEIAIDNLIHEYGDMQLHAQSDPCTFESSEGALINLGSNLGQHRQLTYSQISSDLQGLMDVLISRY